MIEEAYCSFEVARLLKEKGFNEIVRAYHNIYDRVNLDFNVSVDAPHLQIPCPTHQMAMAWLREVHHLYIDVGFGYDYKGEFLYMGDIYDLTKDAIHAKYKPIVEADDYLSNNPKTYEEAVEAALKYCLDNLI